MPFKQVFERRVNRNLREGEQGPAPPEIIEEDGDIKPKVDSKGIEYEEEDIELSEKKDRPPRFSTLFTQPAPPQIIERYVEPSRKSGVTIPTPLFVVLAFVLFFESTLLFAYTVIGLYNNVPSGLLSFGGSTTAVMEGCNCGTGQAGINIAPNFIMPGANAETTTVTADASTTSDTTKATTTSSTSTHTSSSSSSSTTSSIASSIDLSIAAGLASFLRGDATTTSPSIAHTTKVVVVTPKQSTVLSTKDVTVIAGQSTSTSFVDVPAKSTDNAKRASPASSAAASGVQAGNRGVAVKGASTFVTAASLPAVTGAPETTKKGDGGGGGKSETTSESSTGKVACFGGGGAVVLNCVTVS
jgi:hypothetical protein